MTLSHKARNLPKRLKISQPIIVIDVDEDKIIGWFSNIAGAYRVGMKIEKFANDHAKETGHAVVIAYGRTHY